MSCQLCFCCAQRLAEGRFGISVGLGNMFVFIQVIVKTVSGTTQRSVIEWCIARFLLPTTNISDARIVLFPTTNISDARIVLSWHRGCKQGATLATTSRLSNVIWKLSPSRCVQCQQNTLICTFFLVDRRKCAPHRQATNSRSRSTYRNLRFI